METDEAFSRLFKVRQPSIKKVIKSDINHYSYHSIMWGDWLVIDKPLETPTQLNYSMNDF